MNNQRRGTLDALLCTTYCRSQMYLSRQLSQLHPELTMPMFSGKLQIFRKFVHKNKNILIFRNNSSFSNC